ncbi:MAG TPA: septal ring lytic transglycosylase RlpA family protein [Myxococcaceae bacterium]|jgi:rare lipoprotein A
MATASRAAQWAAAAAALALAACVPLTPPAEPLPIDYFEEGRATYYGSPTSEEPNGRAAATREWDPGLITGSHRTLPPGSCVLVTNLENGFDTRVHISERGAFTPGVIIDLSWAAARKLGMQNARNGLARVRLTPCEQ